MDSLWFVLALLLLGGCLTVLCLVMWKISQALMVTILKPLADRHVAFIDVLAQSQNSQIRVADKQADTLARIADIQDVVCKQLMEQTNILKHIASQSTVQTGLMVKEDQSKAVEIQKVHEVGEAAAVAAGVLPAKK